MFLLFIIALENDEVGGLSIQSLLLVTQSSNYHFILYIYIASPQSAEKTGYSKAKHHILR